MALKTPRTHATQLPAAQAPHISLGRVRGRRYILLGGIRFPIQSEPNAIKAVIQGARRKPIFWFNYRVPATEKWEDGKGKWVAHLPRNGKEGITVEL